MPSLLTCVPLRPHISYHTPNAHTHTHAPRTPFLQLVLLFALGDVDLAAVPAPVALMLKHVLAPLAQLMGYKATYPEYRSTWGAS